MPRILSPVEPTCNVVADYPYIDRHLCYTHDHQPVIRCAGCKQQFHADSHEVKTCSEACRKQAAKADRAQAQLKAQQATKQVTIAITTDAPALTRDELKTINQALKLNPAAAITVKITRPK